MALGTEDHPRKAVGYRLLAHLLGAELGIDGGTPADRLGAGEVLRGGANGARRDYGEHVQLHAPDDDLHPVWYIGTYRGLHA